MKTRFTHHRLTLLTLVLLLAGALLATAVNSALIVSAAPPSAYRVNSNADTDDGSCDALNCTLREAINAANANPDPDLITFSISGTVNLLSMLPAISGSVEVNGPGASQLTVRRSSSAATNFGIFQLNAGQTLSISGLTISGGTGTFDGFDRKGGGILNYGTLNITDAAISDNNSEDGGGIFSGGGIVNIMRSTLARNSASNGGAGGGIWNAGGTVNIAFSRFVNNDGHVLGGALLNQGTATVSNSTFSGNHVANYAGAIANDGVMTISNSTIAGNFAGVVGGIGSGGTLEINNSTIFGNSAGSIGGLSVAGSVKVKNSIIAGNTSTVGDPEIAGAFDNLGHNFIGGDPQLAPLQDNGGSTLTMSPLCGSPVIDAGDNIDAPATDQRGQPRIAAGYQRASMTIDIGAVEVQSCNQPPVAVAQSITVSADQNCSATITAQDIDAGSSDPDSGDTIALSLDNHGPFSLGSHQLTLTATDSHGLTVSVPAVVTVVDRTPPVITFIGANPMTVELGSAFGDPGATASDGCSGNLTGSIAKTGSVNTAAVGSYSRYYNVSDASNNHAAQVTRTVNVVDTTAPTMVAPAASSAYSNINCQAAIPNVLPQTTASDLGGPVTLSQSPAAGTLVGVGARTITITGKDPSNNSRSVTTTFTVVAGPSFTISVNPSSVKRGNSVTLTTAFNNCASSQALTLKVSLTKPGSNTLMVSLPLTLKAGQRGSLAIPVPIAKTTPTGLYSLTLDVYVGAVKIGTSTAQLTVTQ
jgi:CSLREA domain-containing protein